jgi:hypothetical protein
MSVGGQTLTSRNIPIQCAVRIAYDLGGGSDNPDKSGPGVGIPNPGIPGGGDSGGGDPGDGGDGGDGGGGDGGGGVIDPCGSYGSNSHCGNGVVPVVFLSLPIPA